MNDGLYPGVVLRVERACALFLSGKLEVTNLQAVLYQAEQEIEALEEKWLRSLLSEAENRLEEIVYTVSSDQKAKALAGVVRQLVYRIHDGKPPSTPSHRPKSE